MAYEYETIEGRNRDGARAALAKAEKNGFPPESVVSTETGWLVPTKEFTPEEPQGAIEATLAAWGDDHDDLADKANIENVESQVPDTSDEADAPAKKTTTRRTAAKTANKEKE